MTIRARAVVALIVIGPLVAVPIGRWERGQRADEAADGMRAVLATIGPLDQPSLAGYRRFGSFDCLLYRRGSDPFALEVCVDAVGRVVEAIDRRKGDPRVWSLREDRPSSTVRVDRGEVDRLLRRMRAPDA